MNRVITIAREFGSGGRELGKRLAQELQIAYYDGEIVSAIAQRSDMAEAYVNQVLEKRIVSYYPITIAHTLSMVHGDAQYTVNQGIYAAQTEILREMAQASDCVIVGRCGDYILADYKPLRIFVYADMESKLRRCREREQDVGRGDRELERNIRNVDKARARYYFFYTGQTWAERQNYDLCVNTSAVDIRILAKMIAYASEQRSL